MTHNSCTHEDMIKTLEPIGFKPVGFMRFSDGNNETDLTEVPEYELDKISILMEMSK